MGIIVATIGKLFRRTRKVGNPLPTLASRGGQQGCPPCVSPRAAQRIKPLRVVHSGSGRIVMSGRMADVCAELDRLAAMEARGAQAFAPAR